MRTVSRVALLLAAFTWAEPIPASAVVESGQSLDVAFIAPSQPTPFSESALRGAELGSLEARRTAAMMNGTYALRVITMTSALTPAERRALDSAHVIISTLGEADLNRLRTVAAHQLVLDIAPVGASVSCDALLLRLSQPNADVATTTLWHSSLERFGAQQLNERYTKSSGQRMDDAAWLGWFASKVALELSLRAHTTIPDSLARFARSHAARFDGQKGRPLTFDARTGVLLQPVYERAVEGVPSEAAAQPALPHCRARAP